MTSLSNSSTHGEQQRFYIDFGDELANGFNTNSEGWFIEGTYQTFTDS